SSPLAGTPAKRARGTCGGRLKAVANSRKPAAGAAAFARGPGPLLLRHRFHAGAPGGRGLTAAGLLGRLLGRVGPGPAAFAARPGRLCPVPRMGRAAPVRRPAALAADLRHVLPVAADRLAALAAGLGGLRLGPLVGRTALVRRPAALAGNLPLLPLVHA